MQEKKIVTWSLIILFLSLTIVYSLAYVRKTDVFTAGQETQKTDEESGTGTEIGEEIPMLEETQNDWALVVDMNSPQPPVQSQTPSNQLSWDILSNIQTPNDTPIVDMGGTSDRSDVLASAETIRLLSGTTQFFGILDIVDILWVQPAYILQDGEGNYFASYGRRWLDFVRTVQQLGGNVYVMATESEILENKLFGDKVSFINMAVFKDRLVLMVIEIEGETRLVQVTASKYHTSKPYLKSLFIY